MGDCIRHKAAAEIRRGDILCIEDSQTGKLREYTIALVSDLHATEARPIFVRTHNGETFSFATDTSVTYRKQY